MTTLGKMVEGTRIVVVTHADKSMEALLENGQDRSRTSLASRQAFAQDPENFRWLVQSAANFHGIPRRGRGGVMASKRSRGRRRFERRKAHAVLTRGRPGLVAFTESVAGPLTGVQRDVVKSIFSRGERVPCPICGNRERLKKDGTFGKHTATLAGRRQDCPGMGRKPE